MKRLLFLLFLYSSIAFAGQDHLYDFKWLDDGETVYVIQNKEFPKSGKIGIDGSIIDSVNSPYQDTIGYGGTISYYFNEEWSIDVSMRIYDNQDSQDLKNLLGASDTKPLMRKVETAQFGHINWIPFYGKINTFNKVFYFDWGFGVGAGSLTSQTNYKTFLQKNVPLTLFEEGHTGYNFKSFFKFHYWKKMNFGFEYNMTMFEAVIDANLNTDYISYTDIIVTMGIIF